MSLSEMSAFFRKALKVVIALLILTVVGKLVWTQAFNYWQQTHTPPPPPPNYALGNNLPALQTNLKPTNFSQTKINIDTIDASKFLKFGFKNNKEANIAIIKIVDIKINIFLFFILQTSKFSYFIYWIRIDPSILINCI